MCNLRRTRAKSLHSAGAVGTRCPHNWDQALVPLETTACYCYFYFNLLERCSDTTVMETI